MMDTDRNYETSRSELSSELGGMTAEADRIASRQRLKLRRAALAVASYVLIGIYTLVLYFSGQLNRDPVALSAVNLAIIAAYGVYFWLIATRRNLHFRDPSLTWPHLILATVFTIFLFALGRTLFAQDLYFFAFMMTLLFGAFGLNLKQILATELPAFGGFAVLLLLHHSLIPETLGAAAERGGLYLASMGWMITFAASISRLRRVLSDRNKELKQALDRLNDIAVIDDLTGVYNRRFLFQALEREIERSKRSGQPLSVGLLDIDHFKAINDSYGHQVGDEILRELITRTRDSIRGADELRPMADGHVLSRFGGEEFLIVLPLTDRDGATTCAERVRKAIRSQPFTTPIGPVQVRVSLGIAQYDSTDDTLESLIGRADAALFKAKANGRDRTEVAPVASSTE